MKGLYFICNHKSTHVVAEKLSDAINITDEKGYASVWYNGQMLVSLYRDKLCNYTREQFNALIHARARDLNIELPF